MVNVPRIMYSIFIVAVKIFIASLLFVHLIVKDPVLAQSGDLTGEGNVTIADYIKAVELIGTQGIWPLASVIAHYGKTVPTVTIAPTSPPGSITTEWTQHAHDAQHTGYTPIEVASPWRWKWAWNGPTASGGIQKVTSNGELPRNVQVVTGGSNVYIAAGSDGIYALNKQTGQQAWKVSPGGAINSTVAYDPSTQAVFAVSSNGYMYKLRASDGISLGSFNGSVYGTSALPLPPLIYNGIVVYTMGRGVYAVRANDMSLVWVHTNDSTQLETPPVYSTSQNRIVVIGQNTHVYILDFADGSLKKDSSVIADTYSGGNPGSASCNLAEVKYGWPVVSDSAGLVFVKLRLCWQKLWDPNTTALYAIKLSDGTRALPSMVVGAGGYGDGDYLPIGPQPVVKTFTDGNQMMYTIIRGRSVQDARWDSHFGQIALTGAGAGQVQEIRYEYPAGVSLNSTYILTDEQPYISMAGNYLFGGHWMAGLSLLLNNSNLTASNNTETIISSTVTCAQSASHSCSGAMTQVGDSRNFTKGFYLYYNQSGVYDRYWTEYSDWVVSDGIVYHRSNDGAIVALESANSAKNPEQNNVAGIVDEPVQDIEKSISSDSFIVRHIVNNGKQLLIGSASPHQGYLKVIVKKDAWNVIFGKNDIAIGRDTLGTIKEGDKITVTGHSTWYQGDPVYIVNEKQQLRVTARQ